MDRDSIAVTIGHQFKNPDLLRQALTHRSYSTSHNERLEFLGDGVLNCVIAAILFNDFSDLSEGDLSRLRSHLVNQQTLMGIAQDIHLGEYLLLGEGELKTGGSRRPSILADALEALIGAVFIDDGYVTAHHVVIRLFAARLKDLNPKTFGKDPKTLLQEFLQARHLSLPQYTVSAITGEAHEQMFQVECMISALNIRTQGEGTNRRSAEQSAAQRAYDLVIHS